MVKEKPPKFPSKFISQTQYAAKWNVSPSLQDADTSPVKWPSRLEDNTVLSLEIMNQTGKEDNDPYGSFQKRMNSIDDQKTEKGKTISALSGGGANLRVSQMLSEF